MTDKYTKGFYPHTISGSNTKRKSKGKVTLPKVSAELTEMIYASDDFAKLVSAYNPQPKKKKKVGKPQ